MPVISEQLKPIDTVNGFQIRPGFFREFGAVAIPGGANFTIHTHGATSCELLLFHRKAEEPYAVIPFPESYRIGFCYSMIVFDLDIEEFEYAYRLDGPYDEKKEDIELMKNGSHEEVMKRIAVGKLGNRALTALFFRNNRKEFETYLDKWEK